MGPFLEVTLKHRAGDVWDGCVWRRPRGKVGRVGGGGHKEKNNPVTEKENARARLTGHRGEGAE